MRMMYHKIECPTCGNETVAKSVKEPQKCEWCRRLFLVNLTKRKGKYIWEAEPIDFPEQENKYRMSMMGLEDDRGSAGLSSAT